MALGTLAAGAAIIATVVLMEVLERDKASETTKFENSKEQSK